MKASISPFSAAVELLRRVGSPVDVGRLDAVLLQRNSERDLRASADDVDADLLALQVLHGGDALVLKRDQLNATGMQAARYFDVQPLLDGLEPGEVADRSVDLAGRDAGLQRLEIHLDEFDVESLFFEKAFLDRRVDRSFASPPGIRERDFL